MGGGGVCIRSYFPDKNQIYCELVALCLTRDKLVLQSGTLNMFKNFHVGNVLYRHLELACMNNFEFCGTFSCSDCMYGMKDCR